MPEPCKIGLKRRGVCVVIPTYNNAGTVVDIVRRAQTFCEDVFVVLDGCTDNTRDLLEKLEEQPHLMVLPRNGGKGNALRVGFQQALKEGFSYAITLDADGQHFPEDIPLFLEASRRHPDALIVGRRMGLKTAERSAGSRFANAFSNLWFFLQTWIPLEDTQTGYRLYPLKRLHGLNLLTSRYEAELELLVFSAWGGTPLVSQDVQVYYPPREERVSHFRPGADFARISLLNCLLCLLALVYGLPRTILRVFFRALKTYLLLLSYVLLMLLVVTPAAFLYLKCGKASERKKEKLHSAICRIARGGLSLFGWLGNPLSKSGNDAEDFSRPAVILCNHLSHLDLLPMLALTPKLVILTTDWVWHNPLYGFIIREADYLPASAGLDAILPRLEKLVEKGYSIAVYPEGTRSQTKEIGRFHKGAFYLAENLHLDLLPLVLYGTGDALPKHGRLLKRWPLLLDIGARISAQQRRLFGEELKAQASALRKEYRVRYTTLADEMDRSL
ncbi:MAG: glycosyltransferase [Bacteroidales bacterium]|nr:glycosyltransferase [Bacteroidales bacterium]